MGNYMVTTIDNPYNPFTHWDEWLAFDTRAGYNTLAYLARVANVSDELSELQQSDAIDAAVDEILDYNILGIYKRVDEPSTESRASA